MQGTAQINTSTMHAKARRSSWAGPLPRRAMRTLKSKLSELVEGRSGIAANVIGWQSRKAFRCRYN
jgi:hypothetical protein